MTQIKNIASLITSSGILIHLDDNQYVISSDHPNVEKIKDALAAKEYDKLVSLMDARSAVKTFLSTDKDFALVHDLIQFGGRSFSQAVTDKVLSMIEAGNDAEPLFNFLRNVRLNPSNIAQDELLLFCVANQFMITTDGHILAYKSVRGDYTDIHSGQVLAKPYSLLSAAERNELYVGLTANGVTTKIVNGEVRVSMERNAVDDNRDRTCSTGLHFASYEYASTWAGAIDGVSRRLVVMKVNPKDVVSIPSDYDNQKGRCSEYGVISELIGGNTLPKKEVYDADDLFSDCGGTEDCDCEDDNYDCSATADDLLDEVYRKKALIDKLEREFDALTEKIRKFTFYGGHPSMALLKRRDRVDELLNVLPAEIDQLEAQLTAF